jgi:16S rRNA G966 N2-methylase RsmD
MDAFKPLIAKVATGSSLTEVEAKAAFDLIFADPPYFMQNDQVVDFPKMLLNSEKLRQALAPDGMFVLEKNPLAPCEIPPAWELRKNKRYGITEINYLVPAKT